MRTRGTAGSQYSNRTGSNHVFKRSVQIRRNVESPVKRHRQRPRQFDQLSRSVDVYAPTVGKHAQHHAVHPHSRGHGHIALHFRKLGLGIGEVTCPRSDHRENRQTHLLASQTHRLNAGREPATRKLAAQFDPMRPTPLRGERPIKCVDSDFQYVGILHRGLAYQRHIRPMPKLEVSSSQTPDPAHFRTGRRILRTSKWRLLSFVPLTLKIDQHKHSFSRSL